MVDLVPELKLIIGNQPPAPVLPPQDAQRRFQLVFRRFIGVFARPEHPLALFLDDLQWLDAATLDLLEDLLTRSDLQHLMLIGAYRDNEVDSDHPLMRKLDAIKTAGGKIAKIKLAPLGLGSVCELIADALRYGLELATSLAELVHEKTGGNPFFAIQFISSLAEEQLLTFDHDAACWSCDIDCIHAKGYTDNVVELMVGKITRLSSETQNALQQLACLGNVAEIAMLSVVLGEPDERVHAILWEAVRQGFVERREGSYSFIHDRIQEAAYSLVLEASRAETHLRIGRLLLAQTPLEKREEASFEIVNQLNRGAALITSQNERDQLAELNLIAGQRAKVSTAYASALKHVALGTSLLPEGGWQQRHDLIFTLEVLTGQLAAAEERLEVLSTRAENTVDCATVACLRMDVYTTMGKNIDAVAVGLNYLQHLGIEWSPHPTEDEARREYDQMWLRLGDHDIEDLIELPLMSGRASLASFDVLIKLGPPALFTDFNLFPYLLVRLSSLASSTATVTGRAPHIFGLA
jgi:predicted ATPase